MASLNIKELCEALKTSRPTIMKVLKGNKTAFRPYMRKRGKAILITKTGMMKLAEALGKSVAVPQAVEELPIIEEQIPVFDIEPTTGDHLIDALIVEVRALREEVTGLRADLEKERRTRQKLSREIKMKDRMKTKAMRELFPWFSEK